jgi:hypothetical protein
MKNAIIEQVKRAIREPYAWPGGYPVYTVMADGELLCPDCARHNFRQIAWATKNGGRGGWQAAGAEVYWEGSDQECACCGTALQSAYGDPAEVENV